MYDLQNLMKKDEALEYLRKALSSDQIAIQEVLEKVVVNLFFAENPLAQNIPRQPWSGNAYEFQRRTKSGTSGKAVSELEELTESTGTYDKVTLPFKIYGTQVKVSAFAQRAGRHFIDVLQNELTYKMEEFRDWHEKAVIWGNLVADYTDGTKYADGFMKQIIDGTSKENYVVIDSASFTLEKFDEVIDKCWGKPNFIICSRKGRRLLQALLQAQQRFVNQIEIRGGFRVMEYAGIPVLTTTSIPDTIALDADNNITGLTGGSATAFLILTLGDALIAELQPLTVQELARTSSQYVAYDIYEYITPAVKTPKKHAVLVIK